MSEVLQGGGCGSDDGGGAALKFHTGNSRY